MHTAKDQCAFVKQSCPDEEAGLFSYLQLYYCKLPKARPTALIIMIVWMGLLFSSIGIAASDFFCVNLSTISSVLGLSESLAGVTFLAFGNGSPDVFSTFAAMKTHSGSLAVGELIGAASFITAVVAGSMALVRPFKVARKSFVRDVGFFIVAAAFSLGFLADGRLHLWECLVMVGFYIFYVIFVVAWHWILRRRANRRTIEDAARSHYLLPGADDTANEPYQDDIEEDAHTRQARSRATTRTVSMEDFANLERGGSPIPMTITDEIDGDDETRDRYLAEIASNMRVSRPRPGERRNTITPIRPSLVGALEFNAVLSSLQKSRNIQTLPLNVRRYSDDPNYTAAQQQDSHSVVSEPASIRSEIDAHDFSSERRSTSQDDNEIRANRRVRAVSTNDALDLHPNSRSSRKPILHVPAIDLVTPSPPNTGTSPPPGAAEADYFAAKDISRSSTFPRGIEDEHIRTPASRASVHPGGYLIPPGGSPSLVAGHDDASPSQHPSSRTKPPTPRLEIPHSGGSSPRSSPHSPFPPYHDDPNYVPSASRPPSIWLPSPSLGPEVVFDDVFPSSEKPLRWWPYRVLPPPSVLFSTLFPTLYSWRSKNIWEKLLGIVAAPSVFLFVVTLPTVEPSTDDGEGHDDMDADAGRHAPENHPHNQRPAFAALPAESPIITMNDTKPNGQSNYGTVSPVINVTAPPTSSQLPVIPQTPQAEAPSSPAKAWNRWLLAVQLYTGPWLIVLLVWANTSPTSPRSLLLATLYSLLASSVALALLLTLTSPSKPPQYRHLICYLGFVIAIAWISTIANEVVGVLKAIGIILNISDAILGLTIFAVGNSCGDLVADITVARLGYPVMALSACFGGPMLNILLGIGLSGLYMTITGAEKREAKHPGTPMRYKPYSIEVGGTLMISGATLLVTLLGLLIVVPMRGWKMDRKVGWALVAVWVASTIGNVIVEVVLASRSQA